ncbi:hypothetical protein roselon_02487 [Roseibacterium elongatum DSM 19469]|uniref:TolA protein n=1 Tax=Roseicyclus elongatus DSM 19469 TaxID=1294273 RepID=W8RUA0_9RHOB|nr:hypothetical protein [Roseibacterium elongatum]AHM04808.1 hypothetical protein roselon_02487 [Roseibacterium elongatum DSM 19469]
MGDSAEFEKLSALEGRLAAALDRVAEGVGRLRADAAGRDGATDALQARAEAAEADRAEAEAQAAEMTERVAALEARLSEAQEALNTAEAARDAPPDDRSDEDLAKAMAEAETARTEAERLSADLAALTQERDDLAARLDQAERAVTEADAARKDAAESLAAELSAATDATQTARAEAERLSGELAEATAAREALQAQIAALQDDAAPASAPPAETAAPDLAATIAKQEKVIETLQRRAKRLKNQRNAAWEDRDAAQDAADEAMQAGGGDPDGRIMSMRGEMRALQALCEQVSDEVGEVLASEEVDAEGINQALLGQIEMLKAARAADAAELARILADIEAGAPAPAPQTEES